MTIKYDLGFSLYDMPEPFKNFYRTIPRGFTKFDRAAELLRREPYSASLHKDSQQHWWVEFPTKEDYMAFILKWS